MQLEQGRCHSPASEQFLSVDMASNVVMLLNSMTCSFSNFGVPRKLDLTAGEMRANLEKAEKWQNGPEAKNVYVGFLS